MKKTEEKQSAAIGEKLSLISPLFLMTLNARINVNFKDFEVMKNNPVGQKAMISVSDLIKNLTGKTLEEQMTMEKLDGPHYELKEDNQEDEVEDKMAIKMLNTIHEVFEDFDVERTGYFEANVLCPDFGVAHYTLKSKGAHKIFNIILA